MRSVRILTLACCALAAAIPGRAQSHFETSTDGTPRWTFALVNGTSVSLNGSWSDGNTLDTYAHAHGGHYIVFAQNGTLYRLDDPARLAEAERLRAPMFPLEARQKELAELQKPYAEQQRLLAAKQKAAQGNPEEEGRIGQEQGRIGEKQGELGQKQGEIGRRQGELGRAFYNKVIAMIDSCLADHSCRPVPPEDARR